MMADDLRSHDRVVFASAPLTLQKATNVRHPPTFTRENASC